MSSVLVVPDMLETATADAAAIGSAVRAADLVAAIRTTAIEAAGADEVSTAIAALFGSHAQEYQAAAAQAATWHEQFVRTLSAAAASYSGTEATIATSLQGALGGALADTLVGRALGITGGQTVSNYGPGSSQKSIVIDFVRHGQTPSNAANLIDTAVPGPGLTLLGKQQANAIADVLAPKGPFAGIFDSQLTRTQLTAAPLLAHFPGMTAQVLPGLNEISAGAFEGSPQISPQGLLYLAGPLAWSLGFPIVPMLAPGAHLNGVIFDRAFTGALHTMYGTAMANPVVGADGNITDVAYSSAFTIEVGTLMNVNNPHPLLMLTHPLPNAGSIVVTGNPHDGWTMVSWDGIPVPPASLPTQLLVDVRDLIVPPQFAAYDISQSLLTGNPATIANAVRDGVQEVGNAVVAFPVNVAHDLLDAVASL
jgi:PE family/Histidine phosphatase superfamily (branch 1)